MTRHDWGKRVWSENSGESTIDVGFYADHVPYLRRRLRQAGVASADVDDLVQEAMLVAAVHWTERPLARARQRNWLWGIAWRIAMNFMRLRKGQYEVLCGWPGSSRPKDEKNAEEAIEMQELHARVLAGLTADERAMMYAFYVDGLPLTDVARRHGLARSTAWAKLQRLRLIAMERGKRLTE